MLALRRQLRSGRVLIARSVLSAVARQCGRRIARLARGRWRRRQIM